MPDQSERQSATPPRTPVAFPDGGRVDFKGGYTSEIELLRSRVALRRPRVSHKSLRSGNRIDPGVGPGSAQGCKVAGADAGLRAGIRDFDAENDGGGNQGNRGGVEVLRTGRVIR